MQAKGLEGFQVLTKKMGPEKNVFALKYKKKRAEMK
jgi:hypothetical protein